MTSPFELGNVERVDNATTTRKPKFDPYTGEPIRDNPDAGSGQTFWEQQKKAAEPLPVSPTAPVNPYAPTGWQRKNRNEFDITLPSGQLCRVMRLEREDLFRMNLMGYLDTFTPMLMEDTISSEERGRRIRDTMATKPDAIANMFMAIDEVCMAACIRPKITADQNHVDYGGPGDWANPNFIATALISDISMEDRFAIFGAAFGKSMDDLKSFFTETSSVASVADESSVQQAAK